MSNLLKLRLKQELMNWEETGPGFQIVKFLQTRYKTNFMAVVYNCEVAIKIDDYFEENRDQLFQEIRKKKKLELPSLESISVIEVMSGASIYSNRKSFDPPVREFSDGESIYIRISPYKQDNRVDFNNNRVYPGTYLYKPILNNVPEHIPIFYNDFQIYPSMLRFDDKLKIIPKKYDGFQSIFMSPLTQFKFFSKGTSMNSIEK